MEGWVKLYRKLLDNDLFKDEKAFRVFIWILLTVDRAGSMRVSRFRTASLLEINPNTFRSILDRLRDQHHAITINSTNKYSVIQVVNWSKYQQPTPSKKEISHHQDTTLTRKKEYKNNNTEVEIKILKFLASRPEIRDPEAYLVWLKKQIKDPVHLKRLLAIEFPKWKENYESW